MLTVLPFCKSDFEAMKSLVEWIQLLDPKLNHDALLVSDPSVQWSDALELLDLAKEIFRSAHLKVTDRPMKGFPAAPNFMFLTAAKHIQENIKRSFLWLESDSTPMCKGWLDQIEKAYVKAGKPFFGAVVPVTQPNFPKTYLNGVAVYPANAFELIEPTIKKNLSPIGQERAWDIAMAEVAVPLAHNSPLFVHLWGQPNNPPSFGEVRDPTHPERKTLNAIPPGCVLYHRCKDLSLIRLLKKKLFPAIINDKLFTVIWPFHNRDAQMAIKNLQWMSKMPMLRTHEILLSYEQGTSAHFIGQMKSLAVMSFASVSETSYAPPQRGDWPPTIAFHHVARTMQQRGKPFLWMEADAIPLTRNWLMALQERYDRWRKPFAGPVVPGPQHMNGTGIYPADTPAMIPITMRTKYPAWDVVMKPEMIHLCQDISDIFCHRWGMVNGNLSHTQGPPAIFDTKEKVSKWIPKTAVVFHRDKSGTLIERLTEIYAAKKNHHL